MKTKVKKNKINFKGKIVNIGVEVNLGSNPPDERRTGPPVRQKNGG